MSDIQMYRGDTKRLNLSVTAGGNAYNLTNCVLTMTVRRYTDGPVVFTAQAVIDDAAGGKAHVDITPQSSKSFPCGTLVYDVELTTADGRIYTVADGKLTVKADVTIHE